MKIEQVLAWVVIAHFAILIGWHGVARACSPACDLNGDGLRATVQDYAVFLAAFGSRKGDPKYAAVADLDSNGTVTAADFALMSRFCPLGGSER